MEVLTGELQNLYDQYEKFNFMIANDDIFNSIKAATDLKQFIKDNAIVLDNDTISKFDRIMEEQCNNGNTMCKLETLTDLEYISLLVMLGRISKLHILDYFKEHKIDKLTLCNGLVIRQFGEDKYNLLVDFPTEYGVESIKWDLFVALNGYRK